METFLALLIASGAVATDVDMEQALLPVRETVVYRAVVPSVEDAHGEVRLIRRGKATVLQTVLHTKLLRRVVAVVSEKESTNWPPARAGHEDSAAYVAALDQAQKKVWWLHKQRGVHDDRRQSLLIEFVVSANEAYLTLDEPVIEEDEGGLHVVGRRSLARLELSREYAKRNVWLIAADSFNLSPTELAQLLRPFGLRAQDFDDLRPRMASRS